jgi:hypothetical protein
MGNATAVAARSAFPSAPIASPSALSWSANVGNWASNPGFEHATPIRTDRTNTSIRFAELNAWGVPVAAAGDTPSIVTNNQRTGARALHVPAGTSVNQVITAVYCGYVFDVSVWARGAGATGNMRVEFLGFRNEAIGGAAGIVDTPINATGTYASISRRVTVPQNARKMRITFAATTGNIFFDDVDIRMVR